jgi:TetR/AcrR family transcriptional regulator
MTAAIPKIAKGERTRQYILEAAEQVFAELGFAEARMEDVAQRVGVRRPSLLYHFKNKQDLYDSVKAEIYRALREAMARRPTAVDDALARLLGLLDSWLDFMAARPTAARIILRNTIEKRLPRDSGQPRFSEAVVAEFEAAVDSARRRGECADAGIDATQLLMLLGNGILNYVCSDVIGGGRAYDPAEPARLENYRRLLHKTARALLS